MKNYIGTKSIKAEPMTLSDYNEAFDRIVPSTKGEDGYLVEYEDGYQSWSPKDVFEKAYKISDTFLDRVKIEKADLDNKIHKLSKFLDGKDTEDKYDILFAQVKIMKSYVDILDYRIEKELQA